MRPAYTELGSPLAEPIRRFVAHKRALNRRFDCRIKVLVHNQKGTLARVAAEIGESDANII